MFSAFWVPGVLPVKCTWMTFSATMASNRRAVQLQRCLGHRCWTFSFEVNKDWQQVPLSNDLLCSELPAFWAHAVCWFFRTWTLRGCTVSSKCHPQPLRCQHGQQLDMITNEGFKIIDLTISSFQISLTTWKRNKHDHPSFHLWTIEQLPQSQLAEASKRLGTTNTDTAG